MPFCEVFADMAGQQSDAPIATPAPNTTVTDANDPKKHGADKGDQSASGNGDSHLVTQKGVFDGKDALARLQKMELLRLASAVPSDSIPNVTLEAGTNPKGRTEVDSAGNKIERTADGGVLASDSTGKLSFSFDSKTHVGDFKKQTADGLIEAIRTPDQAHPGRDNYTFNRFDLEHHLLSSQRTVDNGVRTTIGNNVVEQLDMSYSEWKAKQEARAATPETLEQRIIALKDRTVMMLHSGDSVVADLNRHFEFEHDGHRFCFDAQGHLSQILDRDGKVQTLTAQSQNEAAALLKAQDLHIDPVKGIVGPGGESIKLGLGNVEVKRDNWSLLVEAGKSRLTEADGTVTGMDHGVVTSRDRQGHELFNYNVATNTFKTPDITFNNEGTTLGWSSQHIGTDGAIALANGQNMDGPGAPGYMVAGVEAQNLAMITYSLAAQVGSDPSAIAALQSAIMQLGLCKADCISFNNIAAAIQVDASMALAQRCVAGADKTTVVQNNPPQTNGNGQVLSFQNAPLNVSSSA